MRKHANTCIHPQTYRYGKQTLKLRYMYTCTCVCIDIHVDFVDWWRGGGRGREGGEKKEKGEVGECIILHDFCVCTITCIIWYIIMQLQP